MAYTETSFLAVLVLLTAVWGLGTLARNFFGHSIDVLAILKMYVQWLLSFHVLYACLTSPYCTCWATGSQSCSEVGLSNNHTGWRHQTIHSLFAPRPIRSLALSLLGPFAPWPFRSQEWNGRPFCSRERKFLRTFAPWKFGSRNFPFVDPGYCYAICTYSRLVALPLLPAEPNISNQLSTTSVTVYPMTCTSAWRHWWPTSTTTGSAASCGQPARGVLFSRPLEQTMTWKGGTTGCTRCHATAN